MHFNDIDWNLIWQTENQKKTSKAKSGRDWDKRAAGFAERTSDSPYADKFIQLLSPTPDVTVLDIGSGPGTLAIPLSPLVKQVTALDFSAHMLKILEQQAARMNLSNLITVHAAWEDDWTAKNIQRHDLVIASRSLAVADLASALKKMNDFAERRVAITDRVGAGPFDPRIFQAVGREFNPGPDYMITLNLLYQLGIYATVSFITLENPTEFNSVDEAVNAYSWMISDITPQETAQLSRFFEQHLTPDPAGKLSYAEATKPQWAFICWEKN